MRSLLTAKKLLGVADQVPELPSSFKGEPKYLSNKELEEYLRSHVQRCAPISRMYSIGNSTHGSPLWVLEISDKPGREEAEPSFKYVANMHGDESLGRQLLVYLADWICDNYKKNDPLVTRIVRDMHLYLMPTMNPDGFAAKKRENANGMDLNRDFPDQGAVVANYPWDGTPDQSTTYSKSPDDVTFRFMATTYARDHPFMATPQNVEFPTGITNGAAWYPLYGGMQDWNYIHGHCLELTIETCMSKSPQPDQLPKQWQDHQRSLVSYMLLVLEAGVRGFVYDACTGEPLPAEVTVSSIDWKVYAGKKFGDFYRILAPGIYRLVVSMEGYSTFSKQVSVVAGEQVNVNVLLMQKRARVDGPGGCPKKMLAGGDGSPGALRGKRLSVSGVSSVSKKMGAHMPEWNNEVHRGLRHQAAKPEKEKHQMLTGFATETCLILVVSSYVCFVFASRWRSYLTRKRIITV
ncbi:hypothetical protein CBR_g30849 [Chara braunii]|uniref:Peptidase M14 domain-containing protein n=1 Tax=Chara braunii TaxID=69332 RepID=A0A388JXI8_CHABU|nr:hypothetical protein CBR_g30849 [Chara braunii]|eukprot:GBG62531.1 hypothetical protein CBR_g30849 [Chara braunii]